MESHVDVSSTLFSAVLGLHADKNALPSVLRSLSELQILQLSSKTIEDWIGKVNNALSSRKTRLETLSLLGVIIDQCSSEVFNEHCMSWLRLLLQVLQSHNTVKTLQVCCVVMEKILQHIARFPEKSRELSTEVAPSLIQCLIKESDEWLVSSLKLLSSCMRYFHGPCGPFKAKLEEKILRALSHSSAEVSKVAAVCYCLLPSIGGGGNVGMKHTEAWSHYFDRLLLSAHNILATLYDGLETESYFLPPSISISMLDVPEFEPSRTLRLAQHFEVLCSCVCNMLQGSISIVARVPLSEVISLCCRCFSVQPYMLSGRKSTEHCILLANLYVLHRAVLDILDSLITSCHSNLIPEGHIINQLLLQSLQSTNSEITSSQKPYSVLRSKLYNVLEKWITELGASTGIVREAEKLINFIIQDCSSLTNTIGSSVKGQRFSSEQKVNLMANSGVCEAGLRVLRMMLLSCQLSATQHKIIHEFVISQLLKIHQQIQAPPTPYGQHPPYCQHPPYGQHECRKALYHVLLAQILAPHPRYPPSLHCAVQLFHFGRQDPSSQVQNFCIEASVTCAALMHPRVLSLHSRPAVELIDESSLQSRLPIPQCVENTLESRLEIPNCSSVSDSQQTVKEVDIVEGSITQKNADVWVNIQKRTLTDASETVGKRMKPESDGRNEVIEKLQDAKTCLLNEFVVDDSNKCTPLECTSDRLKNKQEDITDDFSHRPGVESCLDISTDQVAKKHTDQIVKNVPVEKGDYNSIEIDDDDDEEEMFTSFVDIAADA